MRRFLWAVAVAVCCSCSTHAAPAVDPADSHFLDALSRDHVKFTIDGVPATDADMIDYGKDICSRVRRSGPRYDPVLDAMLDHTQLSKDQARTLVSAAKESYCPALLH